MDNLQAPLISNRDPDELEDDLDDAVESGASVPAGSGHADKSSPGLFMWLLTISAGISGLLFGCTSLQSLAHLSLFLSICLARY